MTKVTASVPMETGTDDCFPRGAVDTAKRKREIPDQAVADNLFGGESARRPKTQPREKKRYRVVSESEPKTPTTPREETRAQTLLFGKLVVGQRLLGAIQQVRDLDVVIGLPSGLTGVMPIREVSDVMCARVDAFVNADEDEDVNDALPELGDIFSVGQLVQCVVTNLDTSAKRIELSLRASLVNRGIAADALHPGMLLAASVQSVEAHGYVVNLSLSSPRNSFLRKKDVTVERDLIVGEPVAVVVDNVSDAVVRVTMKSVPSARARSSFSLALGSLLPGLLVKATVRAILPDGVLFGFLGAFTGTADRFHLTQAPESYTVGAQCNARILFVDGQRRVAVLSLRSEIVSWSPMPDPPLASSAFADATVSGFDTLRGLLLDINGHAAFAHISHCSDKRISKLDKQFSIGQVVKCRVLGYKPIDGCLSVSLRPSILSAAVVHSTDIRPGMMLNGSVDGVEAFGLFVKLPGNVRGLCPMMHVSDVKVSAKSLARYKPGQDLTFRVLNVDPSNGRIVLTMKKTLVKSSDAIVASWSDVSSGAIAHGFVSAVKPIGVFVEFYGGVYGLIPVHDLHAAGFDPATSFTCGQVVRVQVVSADAEAKRLTLTLRIGNCEATGAPATALSFHTADVTKIADRAVHIRLQSSGQHATLSVEHLTDHLDQVDKMASRVKVGDVMEVLVLSTSGKSLTVTRKSSLMDAARANTLPSTVADVSEGLTLVGYVHAIQPFGVFVAFGGGLVGLCPTSSVADAFVKDPNSVVSVGQSVIAHVTQIDEAQVRFTVALKQSICTPPVEVGDAYLRSYFTEGTSETSDDWTDRFEIGSVVRGAVTIKKDFGAVFSFDGFDDVKGFAVSPDNTDGVTIQVGSELKGIVLDVDPVKRIVDLNVRKASVRQRSKKVQVSKAIAEGADVRARVELCKDDYVIVSLPDYGHVIAFAPTRLFQVKLARAELPAHGAVVNCRVVAASAPRVIVALDLSELAAASPSSSSWATKAPSVGASVTGTISDITGILARVKLDGFNNAARGRLWIGHVTNDENGSPMASLAVGQTIKGIVADVNGSKDGKRTVDVHVSLVPSPSIVTLSDLSVGKTVSAFVQRVQRDFIWVSLSPELRARVPSLLACNDAAACSDLASRFKIGQRVQATVTSVDADHSRLDVSLIGRLDAITPGMQAVCRVIRVDLGVGLFVEIRPHVVGRIPLSEIADEFVKDPLASYTAGQFLMARVVSVSDNDGRCTLSLRSGQTAEGAEFPYIASPNDLSVGQRVQGYIKATGPKGSFVDLSANVVGYVRLCDLSDKFIPDVASEFGRGRLVTATVTSVDAATGRVCLTMKTGTRSSGRIENEAAALSALTPGTIVTGVVSNIKDFGVFIRIDSDDGVRLSGLAHASEIFDDDDDSVAVSQRIASHYQVGDAVRAVVLRVDTDKRRVSLALKHSLVSAEPDAEEAEESDDEPADPMPIDEDVQELPVSEDDAADEHPKSDDEEEEEQEEEDEAVDDDEGEKEATATARRSVLQRARADEMRLETIEKRNADETRAPDTAQDFERLVIATPNDSLVWCRYIAFQLQLGEVAQARQIGERALSTIAYREDNEKLNVWLALVGLESMYGSAEQADAVLQRAMQHCDQKKLLTRVASMFESSGKTSECDAIHARLIKKMHQSRNVWTNYASFKFRSGLPDAARALLSRALKALPKRKHIRAITAFALMEFKMGSPERGRTILEGVLSNYPKRVDLWNVYLDQETRLGDASLCRRLFERVIHLDLSVKKMKFFFKKYLQFERDRGDDASVEHVKEAARQFVASRM
ncbi:S1 motif domain-containing protein [Plasmodiophora brassicae]